MSISIHPPPHIPVFLFPQQNALRSRVVLMGSGAVLADYLHFSGHGKHKGLSGWESALLLAGRDVFEVGDILALPRLLYEQRANLSVSPPNIDDAVRKLSHVASDDGWKSIRVFVR